MNGHPEPPPEGALIEAARREAGLSVREAARRAQISEGWWRQVVKGYQTLSGGGYGLVRDVPAATIARMARAARVEPEQLAAEGKRPDAAQAMRELPEARPPSPPATLQSASDTYADADEVGAILYQPLIRQRLKDLTEAGDPRPSGEAMFLEGGDALGAGPEVATGLANAWSIAMDRGLDLDRAVLYAARAWVLVDAYQARKAGRNSGQSGALVRT